MLLVHAAATDDRRAHADPPHRLRRLQHHRDAGVEPVHRHVVRARRAGRDPRAARRRRGGRGLAPGRHARPTSRRCSPTSRRPPTGSSPRAAPHATGWRSAAARTAGCSSRRARSAAPTCAGRSCATCRSPTWCGSRASSSPGSGSPSTATPTCPRSWPGSTPTRRTTRWSTAPPTRATLVTTGEEDSRVDPCHARKFAARLQAASTNEVLLRVESAAGHGQGKPATKQIEERADVLAFLAWQLRRL